MLSAATGMVILPSSLTLADGGYAQRQPVSAESGTARSEGEMEKSGVQSQLNRLYSRHPSSTVRAPREAAPALLPTSKRMIAKSDSPESGSGIRQASNEVPSAPVTEPARLNDVAPARQAIEGSRPAKALFTMKSSNGSVRQVSGSNETQVAQSAGNSEVQRKLDELYRKNGREMPSMQMGDLPERNLQQKLPPLPQQSAPQQTAHPVAQNRVSNFFKSISPFKKSSNDERPAHVEKMSPEAMRQQQGMQAAQPNYQNYQNVPRQNSSSQGAAVGLIPPAPAPAAELPGVAPQLSAPQVAAPRLFPPSTTTDVRELPMKGSDLPEFRPVVQLPPSTKSVTLPEQNLAPALQATAGAAMNEVIKQAAPALPALADSVSDDPFTGEVEVKKPVTKPAGDPLADELGNAFPDGSEAEADGKAPKLKPTETPQPLALPTEGKAEESKDDNPFTGLKLETDSSASPAQPPLLPGAGKSAAPALPVGDDDDDDDDEEMEADDKAPNPQADKLRKIAERSELKGFKGFCPVTLRDDRDLADARPQFKAVFKGKVYNFASEAARDKFEKSPKSYAPVASGNDVVLSTTESAEIEGSLDHAVWFRDRLYLFSTAKTKAAFEATPSKFATE